MSKGKSKNSSSQQSQSSSESHLDPAIMAALQQNAANAQHNLGGSTYHPLTGDQIQQYQNPFTQQVIDTTMAGLDKTRQQTIQQGHATAAGQNAFGGSRTGVLDALTNNDFAQQAAQTQATLRSAGYGQALQTASAENTAQNNWPLLIQQMLNGTYGLMGNPTLNSSQSTGSGTGSGSSWQMDVSKLFSGASGGGGGEAAAG